MEGVILYHKRALGFALTLVNDQYPHFSFATWVSAVGSHSAFQRQTRKVLARSLVIARNGYPTCVPGDYRDGPA